MAKEVKTTVHLKGFDDPLVGFVDPLLGYVAFKSFDDPLVGLEKFRGQEMKARVRRASEETVEFGINNEHSIYLRPAPKDERLKPAQIVEALARTEVVVLNFDGEREPTLTVANGR